MLKAIPQGDHPENYRQGCLESLFFLLEKKGLTNYRKLFLYSLQ